MRKILYLILFILIATSVYAETINIDNKPQNDFNKEGNGLTVEFNHLVNNPQTQIYELTITSDTDKTISPELVLSQFTGEDSFTHEDIKIEYIEEIETYEYYTKWCSDYTYTDCQKNETIEYSINSGFGEELITTKNYIDLQTSASMNTYNNAEGGIDLYDMVLTTGNPKTYKLIYEPTTKLKVGDYGLFTVLIDGVEYWDTTNSSDFEVAENTELYYTFDNDDITGTNIYDTTGNENNGTISGATTNVTGKINEGLLFDGTNDYVNTTYSLSNFGGKDWTLSVWVKNEAGSAEVKSFIGETGSSFYFNWYLRKSDGLWGIVYYDGDSFVTEDESGLSINTNNWKMFTVTYNDSNNQMKTYIDGSITSSFSSVTMDYTGITENLRVGARKDLGIPFNGVIDELSVFNKTFSPDEVSDLYDTQNAGNQYPFCSVNLTNETYKYENVTYCSPTNELIQTIITREYDNNSCGTYEDKYYYENNTISCTYITPFHFNDYEVDSHNWTDNARETYGYNSNRSHFLDGVSEYNYFYNNTEGMNFNISFWTYKQSLSGQDRLWFYDNEDNPFAYIRWHEGTFRYFDGVTVEYDLGSYAVGEWVRIDLRSDFEDKNIDFYYNHTFINSTLYTSATGNDSLKYIYGYSTSNNILIDDLLITVEYDEDVCIAVYENTTINSTELTTCYSNNTKLVNYTILEYDLNYCGYGNTTYNEVVEEDCIYISDTIADSYKVDGIIVLIILIIIVLVTYLVNESVSKGTYTEILHYSIILSMIILFIWTIFTELILMTIIKDSLSILIIAWIMIIQFLYTRMSIKGREK